MQSRVPALLALATAVGVVLGWHVKPTPQLDPAMILPDSALERSRPKPPATLGEKLTRTTVKPAQVARSEGKPGAVEVLRYCAPSAAATPLPEWDNKAARWANNPVAAVAPPTSAPPPVLPPFRGKFHDEHLEIHSVLSDGRLYRATFRKVHRPAEWGSDADSVWLTQPRLWVRIGQGAKQCAKQTPVGALVGLAVGALVKEPAAGAIGGAAAGCFEGIVEKVP